MMDMAEKSMKTAGNSDARKRQGGGIVPASPRSCAMRESSAGPSPVLPASTGEELTIAEESPRRRTAGSIGDRVDKVIKEITDTRRKRHISFAVSRQESCRTIGDLKRKVQQEIAEDYDDEEELGNFETPIESLKVPTEKEKELIAWQIAVDQIQIMNDPGAYAYELIEDLSKELTNPEGFRENDVSLATCCAYKMMVMFDKMNIEKDKWRQKYMEIVTEKDAKEGKELADKETQCQTLEEAPMDVGVNDSDTGVITKVDEEEFQKKMEVLFRKVVKETDDLEREEHPGKSYWDVPKRTVTLKREIISSKEKRKDKKDYAGIVSGSHDKRNEGQVGQEVSAEKTGGRKDKPRERNQARRRKKCARVILELAGGGPKGLC